MLNVKTNKNLSGIPVRVNEMTELAQYAFANQVMADMNQFVPALDYDLRNQSAIAVDGKSIYYNVPYARKQFFVQHSNYTTPGTGPRWDEVAKSKYMSSWEKVVKGAMK